MNIITNSLIETLLQSSELIIRYRAQKDFLDENPNSPNMKKLAKDVSRSVRIRTLFSERDSSGKIPRHPYHKWLGAHWILYQLAELGYPPGDKSLIPLRDQSYEWLLSETHQASIKRFSESKFQGRIRTHASLEGNAIYFACRLGLADKRTEIFVKRLLAWQWPDGGWNCDRHIDSVTSSYMESLLPLRGLIAFRNYFGNKSLDKPIKKAAEIFLKRHLFKRLHDGELMDKNFVQLHFPTYWHYDILAGLKAMAEGGFIRDKRCQEALDLLESKQLPDGGFPMEAKYYSASPKAVSGMSLADYGGISKKRMNEFVTLDALRVLKMARRKKS